MANNSHPESGPPITEPTFAVTQSSNRENQMTSTDTDSNENKITTSNDALRNLFLVLQRKSFTERDMEEIKKILQQDKNLATKQYDTGETYMKLPQKLDENSVLGALLTEQALRYLQKKENNPIEVDKWGKQTVLHVACILGRLEVVQYLLDEYHVDPGILNGARETALGVACRAAQFAIARTLLEKSEDKLGYLTHDDDVGNTPFHYLVGEGISPRWISEMPNQHKELKYLVDDMLKATAGSSDIESPSNFQAFLLIESSRQQSEHFLNAILDLRPEIRDWTHQDLHGWTALHFAISRGDLKGVKLLLDRGFEIEVKTMNPESSNAIDFATAQGETGIAEKMEDYRRKEQDKQEESIREESIRGWILQSQQKGFTPKKTTSPDIYQYPDLRKELRTHRKSSTQPVSEKVIWCHIVENGNLIKALYKNDPLGETSAHDRAMFFWMGEEQSVGDSPLRDYFFISKKVKSSKAKDLTAGAGRLGEDHNLIMMLPVIDIDHLNEFQNERNVISLEDCYPHIPGPSQTLDHFYHRQLDKQKLKLRNNSQVFTRYLDIIQGKSSHQGRRENAKSILHVFDAAFEKVGRNIRNLMRSFMPRKDGADLEKQGGTVVLNQREGRSKLILVVSQFWLSRTDNTLFSSFPERRGATSKTPESWDLQLQSKLMKVYNLPENITTNRTYHEMVEKSIQYFAQVKVDGQIITYWDVFGREVNRISLAIDEHYEQFRKHIGKLDNSFFVFSEDTSACFTEINDVLDEIRIIKKVVEQQSTVWNHMHGRYNNTKKGARTPKLEETCCWGIETCKWQTTMNKSREEVRKIETKANRAAERVRYIISLLQGQASTENALRTSEQSRYLIIFTVVSIVFSPLSFVASVLALPIESFSPEIWPRWQVATSCVASVALTFVLCAVPYLWMRHSASQKQHAKQFEKSSATTEQMGNASERTH